MSKTIHLVERRSALSEIRSYVVAFATGAIVMALIYNYQIMAAPLAEPPAPRVVVVEVAPRAVQNAIVPSPEPTDPPPDCTKEFEVDQWGDYSHMRLDGADLRGEDLAWANFDYAVLTGADLSGSELMWASFNHADLRRANFEGANLSLAEFEGAVMIGVTHDEKTRWPRDFDMKQLHGVTSGEGAH